MISASEVKASRIIFLDYLRALACLLVVFGHIYLVGANDYKTVSVWVPTVSTYIFGPNLSLVNPYGQAALAVGLLTGINAGALGVGIFFLVSGFVILRAVDRENWKIFLARRVIRIFPPNIVAVLSVGLITAAYCSLHSVHDPISWQSMLSTSFLLNAFTFQFTSNPVIWTLEIEVIFYLLMGIFAANFKYIDRRVILLLSFCCLLITIILGQIPGSLHVSPKNALRLGNIAFVTTDIPFLLLGSMIYRVVFENWSRSSFVYLGLSGLIFYVAMICHNSLQHAGSTGLDVPNAFAAFAIFMCALILRMEWLWIRPFKFIGDISYSLYLVHVPLGWMLLVSLARLGWNIHEAGAAVILTVIFLAWILNTCVEKPCQRAGTALSNRLYVAHNNMYGEQQRS